MHKGSDVIPKTSSQALLHIGNERIPPAQHQPRAFQQPPHRSVAFTAQRGAVVPEDLRQNAIHTANRLSRELTKEACERENKVRLITSITHHHLRA